MRTCDACRPRLAREYANTAKTGLSNHVPMPETPRAAPTDALTRPRSAAQATATSYQNRWRERQFERFVQRDLAGYHDSANVYEHVRGQPVARHDPTGFGVLCVLKCYWMSCWGCSEAYECTIDAFLYCRSKERKQDCLDDCPQEGWEYDECFAECQRI